MDVTPLTMEDFDAAVTRLYGDGPIPARVAAGVEEIRELLAEEATTHTTNQESNGGHTDG